jgi:lipopolysaccharide export system protein LptA
MRGTRWLLLVAIVAMVAGIAFTYRTQKRIARERAPSKPKELSAGLQSSSEKWRWVQTDAKTNRVTAEIEADEATELKDSSQVDLRRMVLTLPSKKGDTYDVVTSAAAIFYRSEHRLYSEGNVEIRLNVPMQGQPTRKPVIIHSARVNLNVDSYRAETDQPSWFTFANGDGSAKGAYYDPTAHELRMQSDVEIHYTPDRPGATPMKIEAGGLVYHEANAEIRLEPWGKLTRDTTVVEGENPVIHLHNHELQDLFAWKAHGSRNDPDRQVTYAADELWMGFNDKGQLEKMSGKHNARLVSHSETAETTVTADNVDLLFQVEGQESILTHVNATGQGVVIAKPLPAAGREPGETHVLKSDNLEMQMRAGGREIEKVATHAPGTLEFLPNLPAQHHRLLTGNDMLIAYGEANRLDAFHATDVKTVTDPNEEERKHNRPQSVTTSREIQARFDPKTSHLATMEQWGDFKYAEGDRQARAGRATLDSDRNLIVLDSAARMWDATGATTADRIRLDQKTGDFSADGNVNSSRMPDKDQKQGSQMLASDQPLQAQARHMTSTDHNHRIHYEGNVVMWQGANRITAETIDVDREKKALIADRNVVSNLWEEKKDDPNKPQTLTVVRAPHLVYTDDNRLATYTGGVHLTRPRMDITCKELRAYLAEEGADSRLEKAFADGKVHIFAVAPDRTRTFDGEHSEYYTDDQKVTLTGGRPHFSDSLGNSNSADKLTYFVNDDRLLSDGPPNQPPESHLLRRHK